MQELKFYQSLVAKYRESSTTDSLLTKHRAATITKMEGDVDDDVDPSDDELVMLRLLEVQERERQFSQLVQIASHVLSKNADLLDELLLLLQTTEGECGMADRRLAREESDPSNAAKCFDIERSNLMAQVREQ